MSHCTKNENGRPCREHVFHCIACHDGWTAEDARRYLSTDGDSYDHDCDCGRSFSVLIRVSYTLEGLPCVGRRRAARVATGAEPFGPYDNGVPCPDCGAAKGDPCVAIHEERRRLTCGDEAPEDAAAASFACPTCGAAPGRPCAPPSPP